MLLPGRVLVVALALAGCAGAPADVTLHPATDALVATVDDRFLSVAVDTTQLVGGMWWDTAGAVNGMMPVAPFDFTRPRLRALASALAPFYLRIGGTDADRTVYALGPAPSGPPIAPDEWTLTADEWNGAVDFANALDAPIAFTLDAGPAHRGSDGGAWIADGAATLLAAAAAANAPVVSWELGNETNGYPVTFLVTVSASTYAADLATARAALDAAVPGARLAAPASAYWPIVGELGSLLPPVIAAAGDTVDIVTWHYYPTEGRRCSSTVRKASAATLVDPDTLDEIDRWSGDIESAIAAGAPHASLWLGETGSAQCGGEPGVSDAWVSSLWWADELGKLAHRGTQVVVRQSLTGSDYGLLAEPTLDPRPDYFTSLLWKRLVGARVLDVPAPSRPTLRAYAHCAAAGVAPAGGVTVVIVNLDAAPIRVAIDLRGDLQAWILDATSLDATSARLDGVTLAAGDDGTLPPLAPVAARSPLTLPAQSVTFVVAASADAPACR